MPKVQLLSSHICSRFSEPQQQQLQAKLVCVLASLLIGNTWNQDKKASSYSNLKGISNNLHAVSRKIRESSPTKSHFSSNSGLSQNIATFESSQLRIMIQDKFLTANHNNRGSQVLQSMQIQQQHRPTTSKHGFTKEKLHLDGVQQVKQKENTQHKPNRSFFEGNKHYSNQRSRQTSQTRGQLQSMVAKQQQFSIGEDPQKSKETKGSLERIGSRERVFTPPKNLSTKKKKKSHLKSSKDDDKENINALSNQKQQTTPGGMNQSGKVLISKTIINKLKQEVQRQVSKQMQNQKDIMSPKPSKSKHLTSVIPFEAKLKLRKKKQEAQRQAEEAVLKQKRELEQQKSERKKKRMILEQERQEKLQNLILIKKSLSRSPKRKNNLDDDLVEIHPTVENVDSETSRASNSGGRKQIYSAAAKQLGHSQSQRPSSFINVQRTGSVDSKTENSTSSAQNDKWSTYLRNLKNVYSLKNGKKSIEEQETKKSSDKTSTLVQEQIQKKKLEQKQKQQEEALRVINLQKQLIGLNEEYKRGLDEFKLKQRARSEHRNDFKKKLKKKKTKQKKLKKNNYLRISAPQFISSPFQMKSSSQHDIQKISFNSPQQVFSANRMKSSHQNPLTLESQTPVSYQNKSCPDANMHIENFGIRGSMQSAQTNINQFQYNTDGEEGTEDQKLMKKSKSNKQIVMRNYNQQFNSTSQPKRCTLFQNKSVKNLGKNKEGIQTVPITELRNEQMFEEFAKMRKELEKVLKDQKLKHADKKKSNKKKIKNQNMPLKPHTTLENQSSQRSNQKIKLQKQNVQNQQQQEEKIQIAKQKILEKLQEVTDRVQQHYLLRQSSNQQQQTLMISGNIIKEEESRDIEMTGIANQTGSQIQNKSKILENDEMSQIKKNDEESIEPTQNRNENTTFLLNKMYQDDPLQASRETQATIVIQKFWRGYKCRRIIKQKLRIDQEFRLLRQKYEVKNSSSFVTNSLAFSKSANPFKNSKGDNGQFSQNKKKESGNKLEDDIEEVLVQNIPEFQGIHGNLAPPSDNSQLTFSENKFYKKGDEGVEQQVSVFSSPSIQQATQEIEEVKAALFDTDSVLQNKLKLLSSNFSKSGELPPMGTPIILKQKKETPQDQISNNNQRDLKSKRSSGPVDDSLPFGQLNENIQNPFKQDQDKDSALEDSQRQNSIKFEEHKGYLDTPMDVKDLEDHEEGRKSNVKIHPFSSGQEDEKEEQLFVIEKNGKDKNLNQLKSKYLYESNMELEHLQPDQIESKMFQGYKRMKSKSNSQIANYKIEQQESTSHMIIEENNDLPNDPLKDKYKHMLRRNEESNNSSKTNQNSLFEKNSFQVFTQEKIDQMKKAENQLQNMVDELKLALYHKVKIKQKELNEENLSVRSYKKRKLELEKWVKKEQKDIQKTKKHFMQGCLKLNSLIEQISKDQEKMKDVMSLIKTDPQKGRKSLSFDADFMKLVSDNYTDQENSISGCNENSGQVSPSNISISSRAKETIEELKLQEKQLQPKKNPFPYKKQQDIFEPRLNLDEDKSSKKALINQTDESIESLVFAENKKVPPKAPMSQKYEIEMIKPREEVKIDQFEALSVNQKKNSADDMIPPLIPIVEVIKPTDLETGSDDNPFNFGSSPMQKIHAIKEEISKLDSFELSSERKLDEFVNEIFQNILMKELNENLFPQRALTKVAQQKANEKFVEALPIGNLIQVLENKSEGSPFMSERNPDQQQEEDKKKQGIPTDIVQVNAYMQDIFQRIKTDPEQLGSVLDNVSAPLYKDPLMILSHLQNSAPEPTNDEEAEQEQAPYQQSVLSVDLYLDIEKERRGGLSISQMKDSFQESNSKSFVAEMENIHNKAIFDAVNEALDGFRPYGLKGPPLPWSKQNKTLTFKYGREETFDFLIDKVKYKLLEWANMNAGMLSKPQATLREKEQLEMLREERLARILISEADENEPLWIDYEYEETQTKLDLADLILEHLCQETAQVLNSIEAKKQNQ